MGCSPHTNAQGIWAFAGDLFQLMGEPGVILVAEDNSDDALLLEYAFRSAGLSTTLRFVRDGQEALDYLEGRPPFSDRAVYPFPKLLLIDLKMPRLNGFDLLDWLRTHPSTRGMLVGVLSGVDYPEAVERAYRLGARFHIGKPHRFQDLVEVAQFLIHASASDSNEAASFAATPEALAAIMQGRVILPAHLKPSC